MVATVGAERYIRITVDAREALRDQERIERNTRETANQMNLLTNAIDQVKYAFAGWLAFGLVDALVSVADAATNINAQINAVSGSVGEGARVFDELLEIATRTGSGMEAIAGSFVKLRVGIKDTDASTDELIGVVDTLATVLSTTGASAQAVNAVLLQVSQGLNAGALQGDEFRSTIENAPVLIQAWAKALGLANVPLKQLSSDALLTRESFVELGDEIFRNVTEMTGMTEPPLTVARALENLRTEAIALFKSFENEGEAAFSDLAELINNFGKSLERLRPFIEAAIADLNRLFWVIEQGARILNSFGTTLGVLQEPVEFVTKTQLDRVSELRDRLEDAYKRQANLKKLLEDNPGQVKLTKSLQDTNAAIEALTEQSNKAAKALTSTKTATEAAREESERFGEAIRKQQQAAITAGPVANILGYKPGELEEYQQKIEKRNQGWLKEMQRLEKTEEALAKARSDNNRQAEKDAKAQLKAQEELRKELEKQAELEREGRLNIIEGIARSRAQIVERDAEAAKKAREELEAYSDALADAFGSGASRLGTTLFGDLVEDGRVAMDDLYDVLVSGMTEIGKDMAFVLADQLGSGRSVFATAGGDGIFDWLGKKSVSEGLSKSAGDLGELFGTEFSEGAAKFFNSGLSNAGFSAGTAGGALAGGLLFGGSGASQLGSVIGAAVGTAIGAAIGNIIAPGVGTLPGALVGGAVGGVAGGGIGSLFGGGDGVQQMKAVFSFIDGELSASAERLGDNSEKFAVLLQTYNDLIDSVVGNLDPQAQKAIDDLAITLDRSSSTTLEQFATKINEIFVEVLGTAAREGSSYAVLLGEAFEASGNNIESFVKKFQLINESLDTLGEVADAFSPTGVSNAYDFSRIIQDIGLRDLPATVQSLETLAQLIDSLRDSADKTARAVQVVETTFQELGISIPQSSQAFIQFVETIDLSAEAGRDLASALGEIAPALQEYYAALEKQEEVLSDATEQLDDITDAWANLMESTRSEAENAERAQFKLLQLFREYGYELPKSTEELNAFFQTITDEDFKRALIDNQEGLADYAASLREQIDLLPELNRKLEEAQEEFERTSQAVDGFTQAISSIQELFDDTRQKIEEFGKTEEEIYNRRKVQADELKEQLAVATDQNEIERLSREINALISQGWNALSDEQKNIMQSEFVAYIEEIQALALGRLRAGREDALAEQKAAEVRLGRIETAIETYTGDLTAAAAKMSQAAETMISASNGLKEAANRMPRRIAVDVNPGEVGL